ncbi:MAG: hypothetical protein VB013_05835 [Anaerolineaceae bacterium]|nr:hypothetical protein [Anaerolineaceae bacterium]
MNNFLNLLPLIVIFAASLMLFVFPTWRRALIGLGVLVLMAFIFYLQVWPFTMAAVKLITGWMVVAILFFSPIQEEPPLPGISGNQVFKIVALIFIWVVAFLITSKVNQFFQIKPEILFAAIAIFGTGLLQLGMTTAPFYILTGILLVFTGFEILYASIETSILINGLLALMNLLVALVGSYLLTLNKEEEAL